MGRDPRARGAAPRGIFPGGNKPSSWGAQRGTTMDEVAVGWRRKGEKARVSATGTLIRVEESGARPALLHGVALVGCSPLETWRKGSSKMKEKELTGGPC